MYYLCILVNIHREQFLFMKCRLRPKGFLDISGFIFFRNLEQNTIMRFWTGVPPISVTTIYLLILVMSFSCRATRICPLSCDCVYTNDGIDVSCRNPFMDKIPRLSSNTSSVSFDHVSVLTVTDDDFKTATNMHSLKFTKCKLTRISTGSLNGLPRLTYFIIFALSNFPVALAPSVFSNLTSLTHVSIMRNNLQYFPSDRLCELPLNSKVESLNLSQNKITHLHMDICIRSHLPVLNSLTLKANPLVSLSGGDLKPLGNVDFRILTMTGTHIETIEPDILKYIPHVAEITIDSDRLVSLPDGMFSVANISSLNLSGKNLKYFPQDIELARSIKILSFRGSDSGHVSFGVNFQKAVHLHTIYLTRIPIGEITEGYFQNLINSPIRVLKFNECEIKSIHFNAFNVFSKSLQTFYFSTSWKTLPNPLKLFTNISMALNKATQLYSISIKSKGPTNLNKYTFRGFSKANIITDVKLVSTGLLSIDCDTFLSFTKMKRLELEGNVGLTDDGLKQSCFRGLIQLENLNLNGNSFRQIPACSRVNLSPTLKKLDMRDNDLQSFEYNNYACYDNLEVLVLSGNNIKSLGNVMVNLTKLSHLYLDRNALTVLTDELQTLVNLKTLQLQENKLSLHILDSFQFSIEIKMIDLTRNQDFCVNSLCQSMFQNLKQLSTLHLQSTRLTTLESDMFLGLYNLHVLDLSLNLLSFIHPEVFVPLSKLTDLILTQNRLTMFKVGTFRHLTSIRNLYLQENPFMCNCEMFWFSQWMIFTDVNVQDITVKKHYVCSNPQAERNKDLLDYMANADCLYTDFTTKFTIFISLIVVCMLISMIYRYRWHLRYNLYKLKYKKMDINQRSQRQFIYDAFVCYHYSSMKWIIEKMIPELERKHGMKLCIHHRDWPAGEAIVDNIMNSIQQSRTTVFLVSKSFAQSLWGREEVDMAYTHFVNDRRNSIIVILMEDIENGEVNRSLRNLLTNKTYLPLKPGGKKECRFWKTLTKTLKRTSARWTTFSKYLRYFSSIASSSNIRFITCSKLSCFSKKVVHACIHIACIIIFQICLKMIVSKCL